jgi:hypothetical protein
LFQRRSTRFWAGGSFLEPLDQRAVLLGVHQGGVGDAVEVALGRPVGDVRGQVDGPLGQAQSPTPTTTLDLRTLV